MKALEYIQQFIASWKFPVVMLSVLFFFVILLTLMLVVPPGEGPLEQFARDFRVWCFGYNPATGQIQWVYVVMFFLQPLLIVLVILAVWGQTLKQRLARGSKEMLPYVGIGLLIVVLAVVGLNAVVGQPAGAEPIGGELPFPAEQLRTAIPVQNFTLIDHHGQVFSLDQVRTPTVLITAAYTRCGLTCPLILRQVRAVLDALSAADRQKLTVLIITMEPEFDTPEVLARHARGYGLDEPGVHFLTGSPDKVNAVLDALGIFRETDPESGVITHANHFLLLDARRRLTYRLALGNQQQKWLVEAIGLLNQEAQQVE